MLVDTAPPETSSPFLDDDRPKRSGREWLEDPRVRRAANGVAALLVFYWVLEKLWPAPAGVIAKGIVVGGLYSLVALGLALIYRANRIINFAQGDLGGAPAAMAVLLIVSWHWPYPLAMACGLGAGVLLGIIVEFVIVRRFAKHPRLILTVATISIAAILQVLEFIMPRIFHVNVPPQRFPSPFNFAFTFAHVVFRGNDLLALAAVPLVIAALAWFLNRTHMGVAVRACAESSDRASLLGVPVKRVNLVVWGVASLLATVALILRAGVVGLPIGTALGTSVLLRTLAAAVIGRMEKMPTIVIASLLFGVVEQSVVWHTSSSQMVDVICFIVIVVALLWQKGKATTRVEEAAMSAWTAMQEVRPIPPELANLREVVWARRGIFAVVGVFALAVPKIFGEVKSGLAVTLIVFMLVGLSLLILAGWAGQISLGQFAFVGVGSTTGAWMSLHWHTDLIVEMVFAGLVGAAVAIVIGIPALRIRGLFLAVATLGFTFACSSFFLNYTHFSWIPTQSERLSRLPLFGRVSLETDTRFYYFSLAVLLVCIYAVRALRRTRTGRVLVALRENERGVQAYGVNVVRAKLTAFAFSGFLAAVAGVMLVHLQYALYPGGIDPAASIYAFNMAVIGGLGSTLGVFAGAIYLNGLSWMRGYFPAVVRNFMQLAGSGVGVLIILMFLPGGIGSVIYKTRDRLLRRLADQKGIIVPSLVADQRVDRDEGEEVIAAAPAVVDIEGVPPMGPEEVVGELQPVGGKR